MGNTRALKMLFAAAALAACVCANAQKLSQDGEWDFKALDLRGAPAQCGKIKVPGAWDAQGYGAPTDKLRSQHIGVGSYERDFEIPSDWKDKDVFLVLGGISRYAKAWIDGKSVGKEAVGVVGSHKWNVTDIVKFGKKSRLRIDVDSKQRMNIDAILGAAQLNDYMNAAWGGLWGHVYFEARPKQRIEEPYVYTKVFPSKRVAAEARLTGEGLKGAALRLEVLDASGKTPLGVAESPISDPAQTQKILCEVPDAKLWSPEAPNLCVAKLSLIKDGKVVDSREIRTGVREFKIDGYKIFLNGKRIFLRGYGDDHIYVKEFAMPTDKQMYLNRLREIKKLGFNHVRHHSTIMPEEYYDACDEIGMLPNAEFAIGYPQQMPGTKTWTKTSGGKGDVEASFALYKDRFAQAVRDNRNHPCIFTWILGNEIFLGQAFPRDSRLMGDMKAVAAELDPNRFFADTDGEVDSYILNPKNDRNTVDIFFTLFHEFTKTIYQMPDKYATRKFADGAPPEKPVISHETGNYTTFARPSSIKAFAGSTFKPFWLEKGCEELRGAGLLESAEKWAEASEKHFVFLHKSNIEAIRKNGDISGYHLWLIQDYWTSTDGFYDVGFRLKGGVNPADVRKFNSAVVLLEDGLEPVYSSGGTLAADVSVSNFSECDLRGALKIELEADGKKIFEKTVDIATAPQGEVSKLASIKIDNLPAVDKPTQLQLSASIGGSLNDWRVWLFPRDIRPSAGKKIFADAESKKCIPQSWDIPTLPEGALPSDAVYVVSRLDLRILQALRSGARVVLLDGSQLAAKLPILFKSSWWRAGGADFSNDTGTYAADNPMIKDFAPENWCDIGWMRLINGASKYDLSFASPSENIVRSLPSLMRFKNYSLLFAAKFGKGALIVSGFNHAAAHNTPENAWLLKQMIESGYTPKTVWAENQFNKEPFRFVY